MRLTQRELVTTLKKHGYKATTPRRAVIRVITASQDHLTPAEIYDKVRQDNPRIGFVTIYRVLNLLSELKLICEVHAGGNCHSYTVGTSGLHNHLICSDCGKVVDLDGYDLSQLEKSLARQTHFKIEDHLLEFIGRCQDCQKEASHTTR